MSNSCYCEDNAYALKGLCECDEQCSCECEVCGCSQEVDLWSVDVKEATCGCVKCTCQDEENEN